MFASIALSHSACTSSLRCTVQPTPLPDLMSPRIHEASGAIPPGPWARAGAAPAAGRTVRVIAEIKRASPSAGPIRAGADPAVIARDDARGGATALSVLTDREFFDGELGFLARCRAAVVLVGESGIRTGDDVRTLGDAGAHAVLVGEQLMRAASPGDALLALRGVQTGNAGAS